MSPAFLARSLRAEAKVGFVEEEVLPLGGCPRRPGEGEAVFVKSEREKVKDEGGSGTGGDEGGGCGRG